MFIILSKEYKRLLSLSITIFHIVIIKGILLNKLTKNKKVVTIGQGRINSKGDPQLPMIIGSDSDQSLPFLKN